MLSTVRGYFKSDYYEIAKALGAKVDELEAKAAVSKQLLAEAEYGIEKALFVIYKTPVSASVEGAGQVVRDIEDTLATLKASR